jgi:Fe-S-cluster containining protein
MRKPVPELEMDLVDRLPAFLCRRCARCCSGKIVALYDHDIERLSSKVCNFSERTNNLEESLTGAKHKMIMMKGSCILLKNGLCTCYESRPDTCRRHPFIVTEKNLLVASTCKGVDWRSSQCPDRYRKLSEGISKKIDEYLEKRLK